MDRKSYIFFSGDDWTSDFWLGQGKGSGVYNVLFMVKTPVMTNQISFFTETL